MSRYKRELIKKYIVFCEGDTEYNYFDAIQKKQNTKLILKPINMQGGGYSNFLTEIKKQADNNCLAKFVIIDYDRVIKHPGELTHLKKLVEYCQIQNQNRKIPHFLIIDNPDFEYVACLHIPGFHDQDTTRYIEDSLGFKNIENFKKKKEIFAYLNSESNSYKNMLTRLRSKKIIINHYKINKAGFDIIIEKTDVIWDNESQKGSNINELFEIIEW